MERRTKRGEARLAENPKDYERGIQYYPVRRRGRPIDIAYGALYLASDESTFVTGTALVIDGGLTSWLQDSLWPAPATIFSDVRLRKNA
jgi:NAD(P)-dependent dehydrogenase (short-subunit alcohol dehydrogenase family)